MKIANHLLVFQVEGDGRLTSDLLYLQVTPKKTEAEKEDEREELDFMFDEEIEELSLCGREKHLKCDDGWVTF